MKRIKSNVNFSSPVVLTFTFLAVAALLLNFVSDGMTNYYFFLYGTPLGSTR